MYCMPARLLACCSVVQHSVWTNEFVPEAGTPEVQPVTPGGIGVDVSKFNANMTKQEAAHN